MMAPCREGNGTQEHITGTEFSPELSASVVHGSGVMCSDFLAENTSRAAASKTDCSRCNSCLEIPERTELQFVTQVHALVIIIIIIKRQLISLQCQQGGACQRTTHTAYLTECCKTCFDDCSDVSTRGDICVNVDPQVSNCSYRLHRCVTNTNRTSRDLMLTSSG